MNDAFDIDPRLEASSALISELGLCQARLQLDARFPWIVLIPHRNGLRELEDLTPFELATLMQEVVRAGAAVRAVGAATDRPVEKLNIGSLGNIVAQLHVHVVGRRGDDEAWPTPVWGHGDASPYTDADLEQALAAARQLFASADHGHNV